MAIQNLTIIGESINDSVPSTKKLFEANDIAAIKELARMQDEKGASYIDVNIGLRTPDFMAYLVKEIQSVTAKPLSIDTPDPKIAKAGLEAYDADRAQGELPVLNSISEMRREMFELYSVRPFRPILLLSEREESGATRPNRTPKDEHETAQALLAYARKPEYRIPNEDIIFDPGIAPVGGDTEGILKMVLGALELMHSDPDLEGVHMSVGLSNFTVMLPSKTPSGMPVKSTLESAFLTLAMPRGLDTIIGSVKRNYELLDEDHPAVVCLRDVLKLEGYDTLLRVMEFYS
jgi:cobalamin-dependent methionine synthase I